MPDIAMATTLVGRLVVSEGEPTQSDLDLDLGDGEVHSGVAAPGKL